MEFAGELLRQAIDCHISPVHQVRFVCLFVLIELFSLFSWFCSVFSRSNAGP